VTTDDLPPDLLELAARVDDGRPIDWDEAERRAPDAETRAVVHGFRVLAGVAAVAQTGGPEATMPAPPTAAGADDPVTGRWGPFTLREAVGRGAFSTVHRATDPLGRDVAVKLLDPRLGHEDLPGRVLAEGRLLASVKHPNIVMVHGADEHDGRVGLWMEFVHGRTLAAEVASRGAHGAGEATVVGRALCGALAAVHAQGLVHGDVKAHNVMREVGGRVVLMDFGAGQSMRAASSGVDVLTGTPLYLCPRRLQGGPATAATDIYALGVLLYHLVTGSYPVEGATRADVEAAHRAGRRVLLRDRRPDLPAPFVAAVERALAPDPADRFATAGEFDAALAASPDRRRSPALLAGLAAVALLGVATVSALWPRTPGLAPAAAPPAAPVAAAPVDPHAFTVEATFHRAGADPTAAAPQGTPARPLGPRERIGAATAIFLELQASRDVYVYVVNEDARDEVFTLFPLPEMPGNPLAGGRRHVLPQAGGSWEVTSRGGVERLFVVASTTPLPEVETVLATVPSASEQRVFEDDLDTRGIGHVNRAPAADPRRPWRRDAQPLVAGPQQASGLWVRELVLENPLRRD
jgi:hypothetical protein